MTLSDVFLLGLMSDIDVFICVQGFMPRKRQWQPQRCEFMDNYGQSAPRSCNVGEYLVNVQEFLHVSMLTACCLKGLLTLILFCFNLA